MEYEMDKIECNYCKSIFGCKKSLVTHQKSAKYCLSKRGKTKVCVCLSCDKILSTEYRLKTHYQSCMKFQKSEIEKEIRKELNKECDILRIQLEQKDELLAKLEEVLAKKDEHIKELALKAISRPINTTNNQVNINNYMQKMDCVTDKYLIDQVPKLTIEHIKKGPQGYAEYALKYPLNNRILCVDYARRKVKYKDKDGNVITDPEMNNISSKLFQAIKVKNKSLIVEYLNALSDEMDTEERLGIMGDMSDYMIMVNNGANGTKNDLYHEFIKNVCSKSIVD
jgi:hypothetical protein